MRRTSPLALIVIFAFSSSLIAADSPAAKSVFARDNLVAWCIVPFDAARRNPQQRADMLNRLGLSRIAYDWRDHHIPEWDEELRQCKSHGIELTAFWAPVRHQEILDLFRRHNLRVQLWIYHSPKGDSDVQRLANSVAHFAPV